MNGPELRVPPVGLGGPGGTSRYGHYWDIAAPRDVSQIKCPIISVEPTDYNGSKEFCAVSFKIKSPELSLNNIPGYSQPTGGCYQRAWRNEAYSSKFS